MFFETIIDIRQQLNVANPKLYGNPLTAPDNGPGGALGAVIGSIVGVAIPLSAIAVLIYFLWAGFNWLTSGGDKQKIEDARNRIVNAVIGMAIVATALALSMVVNRFFGANITTAQ